MLPKGDCWTGETRAERSTKVVSARTGGSTIFGTCGAWPGGVASGLMDQGEQARHLLDEHGPSLADEARDVLSNAPQAKVVGLVLMPDSAEAARMADALGGATGNDMRGKGFIGLVERQFALAILRSNAPATLDWLEDNDGKLPLVCATKDGFQLGWRAL